MNFNLCSFIYSGLTLNQYIFSCYETPPPFFLMFFLQSNEYDIQDWKDSLENLGVL